MILSSDKECIVKRPTLEEKIVSISIPDFNSITPQELVGRLNSLKKKYKKYSKVNIQVRADENEFGHVDGYYLVVYGTRPYTDAEWFSLLKKIEFKLEQEHRHWVSDTKYYESEDYINDVALIKKQCLKCKKGKNERP